MAKVYKNIETCLNVTGIALGIENIETILGILLLSINIATILWRMCYSIYTKIKEKKYNEIDDILDDTKDKIENIKGGINNDK